MMNMRLNVLYLDGTKAEVKTGPPTEVAFERNFNVGLVEAFNDEKKMRLEWLYFLAWHASKTSTEFDPWLNTVDTVEVLGTEEAVPSSAAASTTPLPLSLTT